MATRRYRNNKNKKVGKKRIGRTRKHRSSRKMRGGIKCRQEGWSCKYDFVENQTYTDPNTKSNYIFNSNETTKYKFTTENDKKNQVIFDSNNTNDKKFLDSIL